MKNSVSEFLLGSMAMPGDHDLKPGGLGLQVEISKVVQYVDRQAANFENFAVGQFPRPVRSIDVATNCSQWGNLGQLIENSRCAHVSGVNDVI